MRLLLSIVVAITRTWYVEGLVEPLQSLPYELNHAFGIYHDIASLKEQSGELVFWSSVQHYLCKFAEKRPAMPDQEYQFLRSNVNNFLYPLFQNDTAETVSRVKRQAGPGRGRGRQPRVRREIRMLSRRERLRYFRAVNALKNDRRMTPNVYDLLSDFHSGENVAVAHFGPNFPSWHRIYLWLFESFLRLHEPQVTVPYWASCMDNEMDVSTESVIWSDAFLGPGVGEITSGPFGNWRAINPARMFRRNIGNGPLYTYEGIERTVNKTRNSEILLPTALAESNFEMQHGRGHVYVGGNMNDLNEAPRDPVFHHHHCFVDYIWERFRLNQWRNGVNPALDYPYIWGDPRFRPEHSPNRTMGFFQSGPINFNPLNIVGYTNAFFQLVQYEDMPTCPRCGGSPYLYCNRRNRCTSRSIAGMRGRDLEPIEPGAGVGRRPGGRGRGRGGRVKRQAVPYVDTCPKPAFVNDYDDKALWKPPIPQGPPPISNQFVFIPVKVISKRTKDYKSFNFYSLDGMAEDPGYGLKNVFLKHASQYAYSTCQKSQDVVSKIKIVSYGLNYAGRAEEYVLTDNRIGVSMSYGFVPVKKPDNGASEVIIAAFDSCGRVCKPYCRSGGSLAMEFTGGLRITNASPLQFGKSYAEATLNVWKVPSASACPTLEYDNIPLSFFCEYTDSWIWPTGSTQQPSRGLMPGPRVSGPGQPSMNTEMTRGRRPSSRDARTRSRSGRRRPPGGRPEFRDTRARSRGRWAGSHEGRTAPRGSRPAGRRGQFSRRVESPFRGVSDFHPMISDVAGLYRPMRRPATLT